MSAATLPAHVLMPPAIYDHAYAGRITVLIRPPVVVKMVCDHADKIRGEIYGCQGWWFPKVPGVTRRCGVVISENLGMQDMMRVMRHERAHCNGWGPGHEGGQYGHGR